MATYAKTLIRRTLLVFLAPWIAGLVLAQSTSPPSVKPAISFQGIEEGRWYNHPVTPSLLVDREKVNPGSIQLSLNGKPFAPPAPVEEDGYYTLYCQARAWDGGDVVGACSFAVDRKAPEIKVMDVTDGATVKSSPLTLSIYLMDVAPAELSVNGDVRKGGSSSGQFVVPLKNGLNTLRLVGRDKAGNTSTAVWRVTLKTSPPRLVIRTPKDDEVTKSTSVDIAGTISPDAVRILLRSPRTTRTLEPKGTNFCFKRVPIKEGRTAFTVRAEDAAGNAAEAEIRIVRDTEPPQILLNAPPDGVWTKESAISVGGQILDITSCKADCNGAPLDVGPDGHFSVAIPLREERNRLLFTAKDLAGNVAQRSLLVTRTGAPLQVNRMEPSAETEGVPPATAIEVLFDRPVNPATVTPRTFRASSAGLPIAGAVFARGTRAWFLPAQSYGDGQLVSIALDENILDLAGNPLTPFQGAFRIQSQGPLRLDPDKVAFRVTNDDRPCPIRVSGAQGATVPGALIRFMNASHPEWRAGFAVAGDDGSFQAEVMGSPEDRLELHAPAGSPCQGLLVAKVFETDDPFSFLVGPEGGLLVARNSDGDVLANLWVPPGAYLTPTRVGFKPASTGKTLPVPPGVNVLSAFELLLPFEARLPITAILPRPEGFREEGGSWILRVLPWGEGGEVLPMVSETLSTCGFLPGVNRPCVVTSGSLPGMRAPGVYLICSIEKEWGFLKGKVLPSIPSSDGFVIRSKASPFAYYTEAGEWCLPIPAKLDEEGVEIDIRHSFEPASFKLVWKTPLSAGASTDVGLITDALGLPIPTSAAPFTAEAVPFSKLRFGIEEAPNLQFALLLNPQPDLILSGYVQIPGESEVPNGPGRQRPNHRISVAIRDRTGKQAMGFLPLDESGQIEEASLADFVSAAGTPAGLRAVLSSGSKVVVTYPDGIEEKTVDFELPSSPPLSIRNGHLIFDVPPGKANPGTLLRLYDAAIGRPNPLVAEATAGADGAVFDLSGPEVRTDSDLRILFCAKPVDPLSRFTLDFNGGINRPASLQDQQGGDGRWRLTAIKPPGAGKAGKPDQEIPLDLKYTAWAHQMIVAPARPLQPGGTYEFRLEGLVSESGIPLPKGAALAIRFAVSKEENIRLSDIPGDTGPIVASGSVLLSLRGQDQLDVLDISDPTAPTRIAQEGAPCDPARRGCSPILLPGPGAAIALLTDLPDSQGGSNAAAVAVGKAVGQGEGYIALYPLQEVPPDLQAQSGPLTLGAPIVTRFPLSESVGALEGDLLAYPQWRGAENKGIPSSPSEVWGYLAAKGIGLYILPLTNAKGTAPLQAPVAITRFLYSQGEGQAPVAIELTDLGGLGLLPPQGEGQKPYLLAMEKNALLAWDISDPCHPREAGYARAPGNLDTAGPRRIKVVPAYEEEPIDPYALQVRPRRSLVLVAGGEAGIMVFECYPWNPGHLLEARARIPLKSAFRTGFANDAVVNEERRLAYIAGDTGGLLQVSLQNPFLCPSLSAYPGWGPLFPNFLPNPPSFELPKEVGQMIDHDGDGRDDRIVGTLPTETSARLGNPVLGLADAACGVLAAVVQGPQPSLVLEGVSRPWLAYWIEGKDGRWAPLDRPYLSAFEGDHVRLVLRAPGGAGPQVEAVLELLDRKGGPERPAEDARNAPVPNTVKRPVTLIRQSSRRTDPAFNLYMQSDDQSVTLAMNYEENDPDVGSLMVSRQGGSLKATVRLPAWKKPQSGWAGDPSLSVPVSRPYVEWGGFVQDPSNTEEEGDNGAPQ